jgi:hypothetical protein
MGEGELPLFALWESTLGDLLDRTAKFPKAVRFTFTSRVDNHALDILERIVDARFATGGRRSSLLREMDVMLNTLRVLLRVCRDRRYLDRKGFEHVARNLDEAGRMIGGWRRHAAGR